MGTLESEHSWTPPPPLVGAGDALPLVSEELKRKMQLKMGC